MRRLLILAALLAAGQAGAADRYAAPSATGSGSCADTSNYCTLSTCITGMGNGDTCHVSTGAYTLAAAIQLPAITCTAGAMCKIIADTKWGPVITAPAAVTCSAGGYGGLITSGNATRNYWWIEGLDFRIDGFRTVDRYCDVIGFNATTGTTVKDVRGIWHAGTGVNETTIGGIYKSVSATDLTLDGVVYDKNPSCVNSVADCPGGYQNDCDMFDTSAISIGGGSNVTITRSDLRHHRRGAAIADVDGLTFTKNICINIGNHSCLATEDVANLLQENNFVASDQDPNCNDNINQGAISDHYCLNHAVIRNNTLRGYSYGFAQAFQLYGSGSGNCNDGNGPDTGATVDYRDVKFYNNSVDHIGANAAFTCMDVGTGDFSGTSPYTEDYNVLYGCPGGKVGYDPTPGSCTSGTAGSGYCTWTEWRSTMGDVDGDGFHEEVNGKNTQPTYSTGTVVTTSSYSGSGTFTYYGVPDASSPAKDAGTNTTAANGVSTPCATEDFFGNSRTGTCDIGAFQDGAAAASPNTVKGVTLKGAVIR